MKITTRQIVVTAALSAIAIVLGATRLGFIPFVLGISATIMHVPVIIGAVLEGPLVGTMIGFLFGLFSLIWAFVAPTGPGDIFFQNPLISVLPRLFIGVLAYLAYRALREPRPWKVYIAAGGILAVVAIALVLTYATPLLPDYARAVEQEPGQIVPTWQVIVLVALAILVVVLAIGVYLALRHRVLERWGEILAIGAAAVVGTLTNTVLVLGSIGVVGRLEPLAGLGKVPPLPWSFLLAVGLTNGIPEIVAAVIITVAVVAAWKQIEFGYRGARIMRPRNR